MPPWARMSAGHPLQRHDGDGAGVLGDLGLLGGDDVHDDAALELLGHAALDAVGAGADGAVLSCGDHGMLPLGVDRKVGQPILRRVSGALSGAVGATGDTASSRSSMSK